MPGTADNAGESGSPAPLGLVTRRPEHRELCDEIHYEVKDVSGRRSEPLAGAHNMISCFADNAAVEADPDLAAVDGNGLRATRAARYFDWDCVCPTRADFRRKQLTLIEETAAAADVRGVRLDDVGFPREGFCRCPVCREAFAASDEPWEQWRAGVISDFVADAAAVVDDHGLPLALTLYPDPFPQHQLERFGVDLQALSPLVDRFIVPLYDLHYGVTHWLETMTWGFRDVLEAPFYLELYALGVDLERLAKAAEVAAHYADGVLFAYENSADRLRRLLHDVDRRL